MPFDKRGRNAESSLQHSHIVIEFEVSNSNGMQGFGLLKGLSICHRTVCHLWGSVLFRPGYKILHPHCCPWWPWHIRKRPTRKWRWNKKWDFYFCVKRESWDSVLSGITNLTECMLLNRCLLGDICSLLSLLLLWITAAGVWLPFAYGDAGVFSLH